MSWRSVQTRSPYKVRVVVDSAFGEKLASLPAREPVWIVDSPTNTPVAHRLWRERAAEDHLTGITTFKPGQNLSPAEEAAALLNTIETHHGEYSANPPYSVLEIIGCAETDQLRTSLADFGFHIEASSNDSVLAVRDQ